MSLRQINIGVPDELRAILNARAKAANHNLSTEVRTLLWAGLATTIMQPEFVAADWAREAALTHSAWQHCGIAE